MASGLVVAQAVGVARAWKVEACPVIVGRVAGQGLVELLGCTVIVSSSLSPWWIIFARTLSFHLANWTTSTLLSSCLFMQNWTRGGTIIAI